ncbi:TMEM184C [Cordylochernes scorpioides]|uniref:TMEM184C n=1 Tax=Cordylochernes scorpioides TaxID=51811 RepID=A0ABY6K6D8_9ARAC|nr:TMEM184C [Cordylochernes scorpioides]
MAWEWYAQRWRHWIRPALMALYVLGLMVVIPLLCHQIAASGATPTDQAKFAGGIATLLALPFSIWEIAQHMVHYTRPHLQKFIIRILWMVPIYSLNAWLALIFPETGIYLDTLRECYEAYVIYNFMAFLLNFLYFEADMTTTELRSQHSHFFPFCCLSPCDGGSDFIETCKHGALQYTVIRPLTTVIALMCELGGVYGEGKFSLSVAYPYILVVNNLSQFVAMYSLAMFYTAYRKVLDPMKPLSKFLCIKAVVFFSFFQSCIISIMVYYGVIQTSFASQEQDVAQIGRSIQDFLICMEMLLAALAHFFAFSHKPYVDRTAPQVDCCSSFLAMWDVSDVTQDVTNHIRHVGASIASHVPSQPFYSISAGFQRL